VLKLRVIKIIKYNTGSRIPSFNVSDHGSTRRLVSFSIDTRADSPDNTLLRSGFITYLLYPSPRTTQSHYRGCTLRINTENELTFGTWRHQISLTLYHLARAK